MKKIRITLHEEIAAWLRSHAAKHNTDVSRTVGQLLLQQRTQEEVEYHEAMRRFLARKPICLKPAGTRYATRSALHEHPRMR